MLDPGVLDPNTMDLKGVGAGCAESTNVGSE